MAEGDVGGDGKAFEKAFGEATGLSAR